MIFQISFYLKFSFPRLERQLKEESTLYGDILQFNFTDDYYNLTLKTVSILRWTALHCSGARFLLKLDDDVFLRLGPFLTRVANLSSDRRTLYGILRTGSTVLRNPKWKWSIATRFWPYQHYPTFLVGEYLIPVSEAVELYAAVVSNPIIDTLPALPYEDVYVTGVLAEKAKLSRAAFPGMKLLQGVEEKMMVNENNSVLRRYSLFIDGLEDGDLQRFWTIFGDS